MIQIIDKKLCCGCAACVQRCPKQCIRLHEDNEGFLYPKIDLEICINCGLCEKVCPIYNEFNSHQPIKVYAAMHKDDNVRLESSSGGIFTLLAEKIINEGGVVFGARFDETWQVCLDYAETYESIAVFRGSKYVQARTEKTYIQAEKFLKSGRKVLFTGSPCQIAGLKKYLNKEYDNLLAVDFVCHGVPSPKIWNRYLQEILALKGQKNAVTFSSNLSSFLERYAPITEINFRNKALGWKKYSFILRQKPIEKADDDKKNPFTFSNVHNENTYMRLFLSDVILRPSCYECHCKEGKSGADLTIADFWGIGNISPEMDDDRGTSLVLIQSERGKDVFLSLDMIKKEQTYEEASRTNQGLKSICKPHPKRDLFWKKIDCCISLDELCNLVLKQTFWTRVSRKLKNTICRLIKK